MKEVRLQNSERVAFVDDEDFDKVSKFKWVVSHSEHSSAVYAITRPIPNLPKILVAMHRMILGAKVGQIIDHKDMNGLNNCRENLRFCDASQSAANRTKIKPKSSMYKGVNLHIDKKHNWIKWQARICCGGIKISLGHFANERDAARAYDSAAKQLFGEFSNTNFK